MKSLQTEFLKSNGNPVMVGCELVVQMDLIPFHEGVMNVTFLESKSSLVHGVALKSDEGSILLPGGRKAKLVYVWNLPDRPNEACYDIVCPNGLLKIWNIYKIRDNGIFENADAWTNNAGMVVEKLGDRKRRYRCSDGMGDFQPDDMVVELSWL